MLLSTRLPLIQLKTYLFVHFRSTFYFCHDHPHNSTSKSGSQREELLVRCDVMIPRVWIPETNHRQRFRSVFYLTWDGRISKWVHSLDGEPLSTEHFYSLYVIVAEKAELYFTEGGDGHHVCHSHLKGSNNIIKARVKNKLNITWFKAI